MDLAASNTSLRKANVELSAEKKDFSPKLVELKSKNEELEENYDELVKSNAKLIGEMDAAKDELAKERANNSILKEELETVRCKVQSIAMDSVLNARTELMEEYKKGEHASWDSDQEIQTWKMREAMLVTGEDVIDEEDEDEEELALAIGSPRQVELGVGSEQVEPDAGAKEVAADIGEQAASHEDITGD